MRILSLNYEFPPLGGGGGYVTKTINERIVKKGFKVDLVTMYYKGLEIEEHINDVRIFRVKSLRKKQITCTTLEMASFVISAIPFVLKLTKENKYDVIHCHFAVPTGIVAYVVSKLRKLEYIVTVHGSDIPGHNPTRFKFEHKFTGPLLRIIMRRAKAIIALSDYLKNSIGRNVSGEIPVKVIANGIDSDMFAIDKPRNNWIFMSGRLLKLKGFQYALQALKDVDLSGWEIHIAGDGPYREELEVLAEKVMCKVVFHGQLNRDSTEYKNLYEWSKIFILPSEAENAPITLLEAMSAQLAVITSNTTGCQETAGNAALLVNPHDVSGLRNAILKLIVNDLLIKELGQKARKRTIENYSLENVINQYVEVFKRISVI